ncbi:uncharacterized protein Z518_01469 [Rhinocladiella mackenziei CBS 650.93]|uniref:Glutathione S-transferase UstS-like C-terminal domain-containing protein n=1 Tax=Rhinocladiella mackenziei CBS 650.93 TaxID=1442369 RepID=A0A0D2G619_9EURO|nr:uncharacterized protein Z518_01469 [Rhinocladiella mackenziei CBS 650.93]KIX10387.1 hypothetical protein Z518_01469 [Rhinocladiella mackenziei CBS 650.93]
MPPIPTSTRIHFFDIKSALPGPKQSFSPNTLRTRLSLNYKAIPYTESFISYPDIEPLWKSLGLNPPQEKSTVVPAYTLPVILVKAPEKSNANGPTQTGTSTEARFPYDMKHRTITVPHFGAVTAISQTFDIAKTLDMLFPPPQYPALFHSDHSIKTAHNVQEVVKKLVPSVRRLVIPSIPLILDDRGQRYFIDTRRRWFGVQNLDELRPKTPNEALEVWGNIDVGIGEMVEAIKGNEKSHMLQGPFAKGTASVYADFIIVAFLAWIQRADVELWENLMDIGGDVLRELWDALSPFLKGQGELIEWEIERPLESAARGS